MTVWLLWHVDTHTLIDVYRTKKLAQAACDEGNQLYGEGTYETEPKNVIGTF